MLDKAIESGKEHRKKYRKSEAFDMTCRLHGSCPWCKGRRLNKKRFLAKTAKKEIEELKNVPIQEILKE